MRKGSLLAIIGGLLWGEKEMTPMNVAMAVTAGNIASDVLTDNNQDTGTMSVFTTIMHCPVPSKHRGLQPGQKVYFRETEDSAQQEADVIGTVPGAPERVILQKESDYQLVNIHEVLIDTQKFEIDLSKYGYNEDDVEIIGGPSLN